MILNVSGGSAGYSLAVTVTGIFSDASVTVTKDNETFTKSVDVNGSVSFSNLATGVWTVTAESGVLINSTSVNITGDCEVSISLKYIPDFTYTGTYEIVTDSDTEITNPNTYIGDWKIRFLSSGDLTMTSLNSATNGIDLFLVGGGGRGATGHEYSCGGGGGGGYTKTVNNKQIAVDTYGIVVGGSNGNTSAFGETANAGKTSTDEDGGAGGSGGGGGGQVDEAWKGANGGSDGGNGGSDSYGKGGSGQKTTTKEFGNGKLYAGGGGGGGYYDSRNGAGGSGGGGAGAGWNNHTAGKGATNYGGGGGGGHNGGYSGGAGGSGIVIIRNKR